MLSVNNLFFVRNERKQKSSVEIRRAEEVADEINKIVKNDNNSKYSYLTDCYAKNGEIYLKYGKLPISPKVFTQCLDDKTLRIYNTAIANNRTMSNARLLLQNNERFATEFNEQRYKYPSLSRRWIEVSPKDGKLNRRFTDFVSPLSPESLQDLYDIMECDNIMKGLRGKGTIRTLKEYLLKYEPKMTSHDKSSNYKIGCGTFGFLASLLLTSTLPIILTTVIATLSCYVAFDGIGDLKKFSKTKKEYQNDLLNKINESNVISILKRATKNEKLTAEEALTIIKDNLPKCSKNVAKYVSYKL